MKTFAALALGWLAVTLIAATVPAGGTAVLMYHRIDGSVPADPVGRDLTVVPAAFEGELRWLHDHRVRTLTAAELTASLARGEPPRHAVVLTFDDGYEDAATVAFPLLRRYGARATFFVSSGFVGTPRHLSWRQMRAMMAGGMEIACHGTRHLDLSTLDRAGQLREIGHCVAAFRRYLPGWRPATYAYPAGKYDATTLSILESFGFRAAFTERPGLATSLTRRFELPRRRVRHDDALAQFETLATP